MKYPCPKCGKHLTLGPNAQSGKKRWVCRESGSRKYCYSTTQPEKLAARSKRVSKMPLFKRSLKGTTRLLVAAAQSGTPVHKAGLAALESAANGMNAELVVIPLRYKNTDSKYPESQAGDAAWADEVQPYLLNQRKKLNANLVLMGDIKTHPTATAPLTGYEGLSHGESAIFGHTKLQLRSVPTPQSRLPKLLTTTGAITVQNFTDTRAGALGKFHNTLGACLVELQGKTFHLRQINMDKEDGSFYDLNTFCAPGLFNTDPEPIEALVMGDTHVDFIDPKVWAATQEMIQVLQPKKLIWHDLNDNYACNHHHRGNFLNAAAKANSGRSDVRGETLRALEFVLTNTPSWAESVIVPSNHNDFMYDWILNTDPRTLSTDNRKFWCETVIAMEEGLKLTDTGMEVVDPFTYWGRRVLGNVPNIRFLERDESFQVCEIELGMHGDAGPNGARGSIKNLRRIGVRSIIGHSHSPGIDEGCYQVGTSTRLKLEYTSGPSSWLNTHCVIYPNGKRSLINIIDGKWRL